MARQSHGGMSPIQLITSRQAVTATSILRGEGLDVTQVDETVSRTIDEQLADLLHQHWDLPNATDGEQVTASCPTSTSETTYVLYSVHKSDTKLDYTWRGPGIVTGMSNPLICADDSPETT